jgi:hypothetical protein
MKLIALSAGHHITQVGKDFGMIGEATLPITTTTSVTLKDSKFNTQETTNG